MLYILNDFNHITQKMISFDNSNTDIRVTMYIILVTDQDNRLVLRSQWILSGVQESYFGKGIKLCEQYINVIDSLRLILKYNIVIHKYLLLEPFMRNINFEWIVDRLSSLDMIERVVISRYLIWKSVVKLRRTGIPVHEDIWSHHGDSFGK